MELKIFVDSEDILLREQYEEAVIKHNHRIFNGYLTTRVGGFGSTGV